MSMACLVSEWSKDPSTKCGAVAVRPNGTVLSIGFNGFPRRLKDSARRLNDKQFKYAVVIHAEENCLLNGSEPAAGCDLYVWPLMPCPRCASKLIQVGVRRVIAPKNARKECAGLDMTMTPKLFKEAGVKLILL